MSEHDWQAAVLAELGIQRSGLVTPDSGRAAAPTSGHTVPSPEPVSPVRTDEGRSAATQWDEPREPRNAPPPADAAPPSAQVRSAPDPPQTWSGGEPQAQRSSWAEPAGEPVAGPQSPWSPPTWEPPQEPPREEPHAPGWPEEAREQQQDAAPNQASAWELASQTSWGLVAKTPWGTEPPPEDEAPPPQDWERSDATAWQRDPVPPNAPAPQPPTQGRPAPPGSQPAPQDLVRRSVHGDPLMRRMSRGVRRAVGASAANEVRRTADVEMVLSRPVPSCRQIAVTSIRGGAGKTTVAGLTATVIAQYRQDRVIAIDADSGLGSLPLRLGVRTERSLHDLVRTNPRSFEDVAPFLGRTADGLWILSGTAGGQITHELDLDTFKVAAGGMGRYFAAMVIDCGAGLLPELQRGILTDAHAQVMVTPGTVDGALSARGALEWQARNGYQHLLTRTVIAFVTHTPHVDSDLTRAGQLLSGGGMPVVHMPYDRHLATGTAVESARIGQETRAAAIRVALEAFARATSV